MDIHFALLALCEVEFIGDMASNADASFFLLLVWKKMLNQQ